MATNHERRTREEDGTDTRREQNDIQHPLDFKSTYTQFLQVGDDRPHLQLSVPILTHSFGVQTGEPLEGTVERQRNLSKPVAEGKQTRREDLLEDFRFTKIRQVLGKTKGYIVGQRVEVGFPYRIILQLFIRED